MNVGSGLIGKIPSSGPGLLDLEPSDVVKQGKVGCDFRVIRGLAAWFCCHVFLDLGGLGKGTSQLPNEGALPLSRDAIECQRRAGVTQW